MNKLEENFDELLKNNNKELDSILKKDSVEDFLIF